MLCIILGDVGSGKTLLLTIFACITKRPIYANFSLCIPGKRIKEFSLGMFDSENTLQNGILLLDEAYEFLDNRRAMNSQNILMSWLYFQSRKLRLDIFLATQLFRVIDPRFRDLPFYFVQCRNYPKLFLEYPFGHAQNTQTATWYLPYVKAQKFFKYYNTYQILTTEKVEEMKLEFMSEEKLQEELQRALQICNKLKKPKNITKDWVKYVVDEYNLPETQDFVNKLYWKLKYNAQ